MSWHDAAGPIAPPMYNTSTASAKQRRLFPRSLRCPFPGCEKFCTETRLKRGSKASSWFVPALTAMWSALACYSSRPDRFSGHCPNDATVSVIHLSIGINELEFPILWKAVKESFLADVKFPLTGR